jgi:hypothetical protein
MDSFSPAVQRPKLLAFAEACDTRPSALRRDGNGDWAISGDNGHIYACPQGYQLMVGCEPEQRWSTARGWESAGYPLRKSLKMVMTRGRSSSTGCVRPRKTIFYPVLKRA